MNILEFENTQGIVLKYETASVFERAASCVIDLAIMGTTILLLAAALGDQEGIYLALLTLIVFFYTLLMEMLNDGKSLGKMIMGLKVVRVDGKYPKGYDFLMRWVFRWLDIYMTWGTFASLLVAASPRSQRLGDMLADTTVIKTRNLRIPLKRLTGLDTLQSYQPKYEWAKHLEEDQVLLIKETIDKSRKLRNKAHQEALHTVAVRVAALLEIEKPENSRTFLQTVIKDYVALTR